MDRYAVMGRPVAHSRSPFLFKHFSEQTHEIFTYEAIEVAPEQLAAALHDFKQHGGKGVNITLPLKETAYQLVDELSERARQAKAINVICFRGDTLYGDNVDGIGLVRDITQHYAYALQQKRILILGAGGAVRGVLAPLLQEQPASITIVNRTAAKALQLANEFNLQASTWEGLSSQQFDVVINGTSASLTQAMLPLPNGIVSPSACCYDMVYGKSITPFLHWAQQNGASIIADGLGMLIEQAAETFYLWRGIKPNTQSIRSIFREY
jgi:shikimate dehydrogenase